ncbi:hypothetical protein [Corynebacterium rhinophilum]|uniref:hypothetical protein n=1 Tax=Corynebacterium rhinophilum TaxID=3050197 RepID=UPI00254AECA8|nr:MULTISPECIES: hypothetical protein [unclassified Corynebacterium]MDK8646637.1 hypothetical protein [Corynebacterium sp. MSK082]MDK8698479.1 hypothetical protein [Corynebacterium sp. MSK192]
MPNVSAGGGAWIGQPVSSPFAVPLSASEPLRRLPGVGMAPAGYVSADGVSVDTSVDAEESKSWSGLSMSTVSSPDGVSLSVSFMELGNSAVMRLTHPDGGVKELFDSSRVRVEERLDGALPYRSLNFDLLASDGQRTRIFVPRAVVTSIDSQAFNRGELAGSVVTLSCTPDANGVCLYRLVDRNPQKPTGRDDIGPDFAFAGKVREWVDYITGDGKLTNLGAIRVNVSTALDIISRISERSLLDAVDQLINRVEHTIADMTDSELLRIIADWAPRDLISGANLDNFRAAFDHAMSWLRRRSKSIAHAVKKIATLWSNVGVGGLIAGLSNGDVQKAIGDFVSTMGANWQDWLDAIMRGDVDHLIDNAIASVDFPALGDALANMVSSAGFAQWAGPIRAWAGRLGQMSGDVGKMVGDALRGFLNRQNITDVNEFIRDAMRRWNDISGDFIKRMSSGEILSDIARAGSNLYRAAQRLWDSVIDIVRDNWGVFNPSNLVKAWNAFLGSLDPAQYGDIANRFLTDWNNPAALANDVGLLASAIAGDVVQGWIAALNALNLGQVIPQLTGAWDAFLDGVNKAIAELSTQDLVLVGVMLVLPVLALLAGLTLTVLLAVFGQPLLAVPVALSTAGLLLGMLLVALKFFGFGLGGVLLPWAADLIVIALLTGHPLAALFIFWSVVNGAKFIILDFPLVVIAGALPVTLKAIVLFLAAGWALSHFAVLAAIVVAVALKIHLLLRITQPLRLTGVEKAVVAVAIAVTTFVIVALFASTVVGLVVFLMLRSSTLSGRSLLLNLVRTVVLGGALLPVIGVGIVLAVLRLLRFRVHSVPPVVTAVAVSLPIVQVLVFRSLVTARLAGKQLGAAVLVVRPLVRFGLAVLFLLFATVGALLPVAGAGVASFVTALVAIPASIIFYVASVAWVASHVAAFPLLKKAVAPVLLALGAIVALSFVATAVATLLLLPILAPPVVAAAAAVAAAFATVGVTVALFVGHQLALVAAGLHGGGQLLLRAITAGVMLAGMVFMTTGIFAGVGPWVVRLVLRGVEAARSAVSVGFIPVFAAPTRLLYPLRRVGTSAIGLVTGLAFPVVLLTLPTLFLPFRGIIYRVAVPLTIFRFILNWNILFHSVDAFNILILLALVLIAAVTWVAWVLTGGPASPASAPFWWATSGASILAGLLFILILLIYIPLYPVDKVRRIITPIALPWTFLDAFGVDTVTTLGIGLAHIVARTRGIIGILLRPILPLLVGILGSSVIAAARWMGWKVPILGARLLTPVAIALGVNHRFIIAALVTLTWVGQRLKRWPKFALSSIATVVSAIVVALATARGVHHLLLDAGVIAGAFPWMKVQKLERLALGLMISAVVTVFVGVPLLLAARKLAQPWRVLAKLSLLTIAVTFAAASLTIVPGVAGAIILFLAASTFLTMVATHPRVLLTPLAGLLTVVTGLILAAAVAFLAAGTPLRVGRRLFRRVRLAAVIAATPIIVWAVLILSAALLIVTVASISHTIRAVDLISSLAVFAAVVGLLGVVLGSLALTLFNRVAGVVLAGIVTVTFIAVSGLILILSLVPIYLRVVNTIAFPLVGIPLDIFNLLTRHSPLGRLVRLWVITHLAVLAIISLGLVAVVIVLNIAGTITGFVAVSGIAISIVLAYVYFLIPLVIIAVVVSIVFLAVLPGLIDMAFGLTAALP